MRAPSSLLRTPPYVTPRPVITHRKLHGLPLDSPDSPESHRNRNPKSTFRFIVLATDGLWDELSSKDVVTLVGGHLSGLKGTVSQDDLAKLVPTAEGSMGVQGKEDRGSSRSGP